ncbi:hypothetical protein OSJ77_19495 [Phyllobacterium sp. 0TCS1.6C]|jgi:hypothetical protein|uniref:hypothetical protein n=1 Tax=unclassified Phyllobacterium TaxID=2638441 RepID=UPI002264AB98|nr:MULTISPECIES: hypothetical protein [unclassified Phyllobacterium]MCX8282382.1 hypothetical protein [Phyllobacterium sp. 0TCS1.6C]MCX8295265.1 hypothetical protein [Phyllobacterium sp. 0TCS1.6A]
MRRLVNVAVLLVAIGVLFAMQQTKPRYGELTGAIPVHGKMHEKVRARQFEVTLDEVVFARELAVTEFGKTRIATTSGLWAIVTAELGATESSTGVSSAIWKGPTGLLFNLSDRGGSSGDQQPPFLVEPGLPKKVRFVFEINPDQVNGATLLVSSKMEPVLDSEARISIDDFRKFNDGAPLTVDRFDLSRPVNIAGN